MRKHKQCFVVIRKYKKLSAFVGFNRWEIRVLDL